MRMGSGIPEPILFCPYTGQRVLSCAHIPVVVEAATWCNGHNTGEGRAMKISEMVHEILDEAIAAENGRKADIVVNDGPLRQTLIALRAGIELAPHNSPPAASILVLKGEVIVAGSESTPIGEGEIVALTHERHSVRSLEDSIFLLTTVTSVPGQGSHDGA